MIDRGRTIRLLERHGLSPRKALGQNFVVDDSVIDQIVRLAQIGPDSSVLEVGPGLGALTVALARSAAHVVAVEKDDSLIPLLRGVIESQVPPATDELVTEEPASGDFGAVASEESSGRVRMVAGDAMDMDWPNLLARSPEWVLVANLPYNVALPILMSIMKNAPMVTRGVVMVQQEVAERLAASPGGRTIGVPSIELAWYAEASVGGAVPPDAFHPVPNVSSALLEIHRRGPPSKLVSVDDVMRLVGPAYRKRRKMLRTSLAHLAPPDVLVAAGIDPTARPETLALADWVGLAEQVAAT